MIVRWIIFPIVCIAGWLAICAYVGQIDVANDAIRLEQRGRWK